MPLETHTNREMFLGSLPIRRALPTRGRRVVGPWCFLDRFGPLAFAGGKPMDVPKHPHIGLQTVSWLLDGEVLHDDSLGSSAIVRPGGVNVMTSGRGIAHTEQTPASNTGRLDGVQLWIALPQAQRHQPPSFASIDEVPAFEAPGGIGRVFAGTMLEATSPAPHYSSLIGCDIGVHAGSQLDVPLDAAFEHAILLLSGDAAVNGQHLADATLYYLAPGPSEAGLGSHGGCRLLLIGGSPFEERILMWWNFVARTPEEIAEARADWEAHRRFGDVAAYDGPRLDAPELARLAPPNPAS